MMIFTVFNRIKFSFLVLIPITAGHSFASNQQFCFSYASSLYEQVYCELKAEGHGKKLPGLFDFKNNNQQMQYLLLKPQVRKLAMKLPKPILQKANKSQERTIAISKQVNKPTIESIQQPHLAQSQALCSLDKDIIRCGDTKHLLQYNVNNKRLDSEVFSENNTMDLPQYNGSNINQYLAQAYAKYIDKMLELGLAGVTLSYSKFHHLFDELQQRDMNFSKRFETMYFYLKKDKKNMMVNTQKIIPRRLKFDQCDALNQYWICATATKNYIFKQI